MRHQLVHFLERAFVEEPVHTLSRREFAFAVLALAPFRAPAFFRRGVSSPHFLQTIHIMAPIVKCGGSNNTRKYETRGPSGIRAAIFRSNNSGRSGIRA